MKQTYFAIAAFAAFVAVAGQATANIISEFEPNPAGADPADTTIELFGLANTDFSFNILSIENDGFSGIVDRAAFVTGTYDANGLAVVTVPDLENPSFTLILSQNSVDIGTDLDLLDNGTLDVSALGTIFDSVGVSDILEDDAVLYSTSLGGSSILFNGAFEPLNVFRDGSSGEFFQTVTLDFGTPDERIGIFAADGTELDPSNFSGDITSPSFGFLNPTFSATVIPEPSSLIVLGLTTAGFGFRRHRKRRTV